MTPDDLVVATEAYDYPLTAGQTWIEGTLGRHQL